MIKNTDLFDLSHTLAAGLFDGAEYPWQVLAPLEAFIRALGPTLPEEQFELIGEEIWAARDARIAPGVSITGPCIIDQGAEVRPNAYIRGSVIVGKGAVVGNATELKNCLLFDGVQVPHYNYVGDSVLGYKAHFGAGVITSNVKGDKSLVVIKTPDGPMDTNRKKVGAMAGDHCEVGCNTVLNPGTILGRGAQVYPLCSVRGVVPEGCIYKGAGNCVPRQQKDG